jgi:uncharacterized PurR-regulated membrane protein YhhQ (DUF165 family)
MAYLAAIVAINFGFEHTSVVMLPGGAVWPPMSIAVGAIFVLRDYAQRAAGDVAVMAWMIAGAVISYFMASPAIAAASLAAFVVSEAVDWLVYTTTKRSMAQRVALSSVISAPIDSAAFLYLIGMLSPTSVAIMTASKVIGITACMAATRRSLA